MRFRTWRALPLALSLAALGLGLGTTTRAQAQWSFHTIPRTSPAYNYTTGGEYMAPPVPYGHYAKDYVGAAYKQAAMVKGHVLGKFTGLGMGHHGDGDCDGCGAGVFGQHGGSGCGEPGCFGGMSCGILGHGKHGGGSGEWGAGMAGYATTMNGVSAQSAPIASGQMACGQSGCNIGGKHSHLGHTGSGTCGDPGCGIGFAHGHGNGDGGCGFCGGKGCMNCLGKGGGHLAAIHGKLASLAAGLHHPKMKWFVGPGGPVPLTPGYVPYIVTTRSPRDFFAFPPMNPNDP
jgi:hypothetical protein